MTTTQGEVPLELSGYLVQLAALADQALQRDLLGLWLIGSVAQGAYEHKISDVDVLAVSRSRWPLEVRQSLGRQLVHPTLPCPTAGLEFVWPPPGTSVFPSLRVCRSPRPSHPSPPDVSARLYASPSHGTTRATRRRPTGS